MPDYKNSFKSPVFREEVIVDENGTTLGTIRLRPSGFLWKPANSPKYYSVKLDKFVDWITDRETKATRTSSWRVLAPAGATSCSQGREPLERS